MTEEVSAHYKHHRFPAEIIAHAVWLYYRFPLSLREARFLYRLACVCFCPRAGPATRNGWPKPGSRCHAGISHEAADRSRRDRSVDRGSLRPGAEWTWPHLGGRQPKHRKVYPYDVELIFPVSGNGHGRPRKHPIPDTLSVAAETIQAGSTRKKVRLRHGTKGRLAAHFAAARIRIADGSPQRILDKGQQHMPGEEAWLVGEWRSNRERKYYLSNLPADATCRLWCRVQRTRTWMFGQSAQRDRACPRPSAPRQYRRGSGRVASTCTTTNASDVRWSAEEYKGNHRVAATYADGRRR